jgi:hypothetical protein
LPSASPWLSPVCASPHRHLPSNAGQTPSTDGVQRFGTRLCVGTIGDGDTFCLQYIAQSPQSSMWTYPVTCVGCWIVAQNQANCNAMSAVLRTVNPLVTGMTTACLPDNGWTVSGWSGRPYFMYFPGGQCAPTQQPVQAPVASPPPPVSGDAYGPDNGYTPCTQGSCGSVSLAAPDKLLLMIVQ